MGELAGGVPVTLQDYIAPRSFVPPLGNVDGRWRVGGGRVERRMESWRVVCGMLGGGLESGLWDVGWKEGREWVVCRMGGGV